MELETMCDWLRDVARWDPKVEPYCQSIIAVLEGKAMTAAAERINPKRMTMIQRPARMGKTTEMARIAREHGAMVVVPTGMDVKRHAVMEEFKNLTVLTWHEFCQGRAKGQRLRDVVIDDLDLCLSFMAPAGGRIIAASITSREESNP